MPAPSSDKLVVVWSKSEQDFLIRYPRRADGHLAAQIFTSERVRPDYESPRDAPLALRLAWDPSFVDELKRRGYDTTTLRFEVRLLKAK